MTTKSFHPHSFVNRHVGPSASQVAEMLQTIGGISLDELIEQTIPDSIRLQMPLNLPAGLSEHTYLQHIGERAQQNRLWKSYIGMGYYDTVTPSVIQRNIFENPGWYTQYTPYQAEISQGRLEALLNFQTLVADLTGLPIANASLLDEGSAAAEAMQMLHRVKNRRAKQSADTFLVDDACSPFTINVLQTRAEPLGIVVKILPHAQFVFSPDVFGCLLAYPNQIGGIADFTDLVENAKQSGTFTAVIADLLSLTLLTPPGEWGADVAIGNTQRFGVPLGYGGPHAAYFATREEFVRQVPGRIIGLSRDRAGQAAYRMALQTREQHIRRDKATSNICTAQALLAIMASMYAVYHGPDGLRLIAKQIHELTALLNDGLAKLGYQQRNAHFFDTLLVDLKQHTATSGLRIRRVAELEKINFRYFKEDGDLIGISLDESCSVKDVNRILRVFAEAADLAFEPINEATNLTAGTSHFPEGLKRRSDFLTHPVFNTHRTETQMMRYIKSLEEKDLSLTRSMIPLGSCTMKLNAATQLMPLSLPHFSKLHPFVPLEQAAGYRKVFEDLEKQLCEITGFAACSLQPNSGAQGEYAGLMAIRAYHRHNGNEHRDIALIPASAHGTNPASAIMAGMKVVMVKCDDNGNIDLNDLKLKAEKFGENLAALMITYPSTHGVFEGHIKEVCRTVHEHGGQIYMDGANMNAQVGLTNPASIGADVCHLNLHKTFSIPHGGGGPGMGPICVAEHLADFLPGHDFLANKQLRDAVGAVASTPWSSASILLISYAYIKLLGASGLLDATKQAILNANYIKSRLEVHYPVLYVGEKGRVAHELILDLRPFERSAGINAIDVAKRLMDYGFHAPTVSFPVAGTLMIEPTESEDKAEIDRFCDAMIAIRGEIRDLEEGIASPEDNPISNAPHTLAKVTADEWKHTYSRSKAAFPLPYLYHNKFWASVARTDDAYGDRNLMCTCPPVSEYAEVGE